MELTASMELLLLTIDFMELEIGFQVRRELLAGYMVRNSWSDQEANSDAGGSLEQRAP